MQINSLAKTSTLFYSVLVHKFRNLLIAFLGCVFVVALGVGGVIMSRQDNDVLGVLSPLSEEHTQGADQYRFIFEESTVTPSYPPNDYFPYSTRAKYSEDIDVQAEAYAVMDRKNRQLLFSKNLTLELPIASVTKIMTALIALENADLDARIKVSESAASIGEAEMGLTGGEILTVEELLYGLMLPSGNDAAEALAEGVGRSRTSFVLGMNEKAKELGLLDTYYFNPTGLDGDTIETTSFSTPLDLLALTNYALTNPTFAKIVATHEKELPYIEGTHKAFYLNNILQLDRNYPGIKGVKPGNTDFANETLVSYAENGDTELIVVLLGVQNTRDEVIKLYDQVYQKLGIVIPGR